MPQKKPRRLRKVILRVVAVLLLAPVALTLLYTLVPPPVTPLMLLRLFEGESLKRDWVPLAAMAAPLPQAVIASEDNLFCEHNGFDWQSLEMAVRSYAAGERAGGGSTISMQTAKNLFLWPQRSVFRKILEAPLTLLIELTWNKQRILEVYLNVVEWGPGIYGAEAAAQKHFGKSAGRLTAREAALLAAVLPNPRVLSAGRPSDHVAGRARVIRTRIAQLGPLLDCVGS